MSLPHAAQRGLEVGALQVCSGGSVLQPGDSRNPEGLAGTWNLPSVLLGRMQTAKGCVEGTDL